MNTPRPLTKVQMIEASLRCFVLGLIGVLPVIGIPLAVAALFQYRRVRLGAGATWNPASRYLRAGRILAALGLLATALLAGAVLCAWVSAFQ